MNKVSFEDWAAMAPISEEECRAQLDSALAESRAMAAKQEAQEPPLRPAARDDGQRRLWSD